MSIEALWTVRFGDPNELQGGVIVLETGRMFGGDSIYAYSGRFDLDGGSISAELDVIRHNFTEGLGNIYGTDEPRFRVRFEGQREGEDRITGRLIREGYPDGVIVMERLEPLP
jgi:hypothetical protein